MKIKNQFPKTLFFFDFFNPLKTNKDQIFKPKTLLKLVAKTLKKIGIFALEIVDQNSPKEWVFIAILKN